jgi:hypothetical protein
MELSKAVAGTALLFIVLLALGHASAPTKSQEPEVKPPEKSAPGAEKPPPSRSKTAARTFEQDAAAPGRG